MTPQLAFIISKLAAHHNSNNFMQLDLIFNENRLPKAPYCTDTLGNLAIRRLKTAVNRKYIQVNPPKLFFWLCLDVDRQGGGLAWEDANLPSPNFATINPANGHAHLVWGLSAPVLTTEAAREAPLRYLNSIRNAYTALTGADQGYTGLITKNPLHSHWRTLYGHGHLFDLPELAEYVPDLNKYTDRTSPAESVGIGRNVALFQQIRHWAYREIRLFRGAGRQHFTTWSAHVLEQVEKRNGDFTEPLPFSEVKAIAKSIAKWVWAHDPHAEQRFIERQAYRGALGGIAKGKANEEKRIQARLMHAKGMSLRSIASELQCSPQSVSNWVSK